MTMDTFLFDLDGTLVDSLADIAANVNLLRKELGLEPMTLGEVATRVGDGSRKLLERSLPEGLFGEEALARFLQLYEEHVCDESRLYPGILDFLQTHPPGQMGIVSNKPRHLSEIMLNKLEIRKYFAAVLGPESCTEKKPHPAPVLKALRILKADPATAVMIGDHHTDLKAGKGAGIRTCFCAWGIGEDGGFPCDYFAGSPADLMKIFPLQ